MAGIFAVGFGVPLLLASEDQGTAIAGIAMIGVGVVVLMVAAAATGAVIGGRILTASREEPAPDTTDES